MASTIQESRAAIRRHTEEITAVLVVQPLDLAHIEERAVAIIREVAKIRTATRLCAAAPHLNGFLNKYFPTHLHI